VARADERGQNIGHGGDGIILKERKKGLKFLTSAGIKMVVFWVSALCVLAEVHLRFRDTCCFLPQGKTP
jgi:hypothetical protein